MGTKSNAYSAAPPRNAKPPLLRHRAAIRGPCEGSARRDADEVGDVNSDGGFGIWRGVGGRRRVEATRLWWVYVGSVDGASTRVYAVLGLYEHLWSRKLHSWTNCRTPLCKWDDWCWCENDITNWEEDSPNRIINGRVNRDDAWVHGRGANNWHHMLAVVTAESPRLDCTKHQYKLCGQLGGTAYFQNNADRLLRNDQAGCDVDVVIVPGRTQIHIQETK